MPMNVMNPMFISCNGENCQNKEKCKRYQFQTPTNVRSSLYLSETGCKLQLSLNGDEDAFQWF